jgi:hypothetical protein
LWRRWRVWVDGGWDNRNRLYVSAWWASETECGVTVGYGNRNSDPVWCVDRVGRPGAGVVAVARRTAGPVNYAAVV